MNSAHTNTGLLISHLQMNFSDVNGRLLTTHSEIPRQISRLAWSLITMGCGLVQLTACWFDHKLQKLLIIFTNEIQSSISPTQCLTPKKERERERLRVRRTSVDITLVLTQVTSKSLSAGSRLWNASSGSECSTTSTITSSKNRHLLFTEWCAASRQVLVPVRVLITMMPFTRE